jgi:hypothetical protein
MTYVWDEPRLLEAMNRLPRGRPFSTTEALGHGVRADGLRALVVRGELRHPVRGLYAPACLVDDLRLRVRMLRLVVPPDCVVTDRTAAWLWGADAALGPGDHLVTPPVSVFAPPGRRLRNGLVDSGERWLRPDDVREIDGLRVTTALRTTCDLARLLPRDQSLAAMDALTALGAFSVGDLHGELDRFKGYRGIIQARALAPLVDPRSGSHSESVMRLRWLDAGLPRPECQVEIPGPHGGSYYLDMGLRDLRFAGEYDGEQFHGEDRRESDDDRRWWAREVQAWTIVVGRRHNVYGRKQDIGTILRREYRALTSK